MSSKVGLAIGTLVIGCLLGCTNPATSASSAKAITSFSIFGASGTIAGATITVMLPYYPVNVAGLVATFVTSGNLVTVNGVTQKSGVTSNNFTSPVTYFATAQDGSTANYTVMVTAPTSCTSAAGCAPGYGCSALHCVAKAGSGSPCTANSDCLSGSCVGGVCN